MNETGENHPVSAKCLYEQFLGFVVRDDENGQDSESIVPFPTFRSYLSKNVKRPEMAMNSDGKGYYYQEVVQEEEESVEVTSRRTQNKMLERKLYKAIGQYFHEVEGLRSLITANQKPKGATKYSIPDISLCEYRVGFSSYSEIELLAVEIKHSPQSTTIDSMLQAVNHKNICGSSLLLYPVRRSDKEKIDENLTDLIINMA